uniref:Ribosomal protein S2 n=1 Tax=Amicula sp. isolate GU52X-4 cfCalB7 TaxID=3003489 RepID=A0A9E8Z787_9STRA|nr:ribosomal protein S2 [Amicula sp. isolate GU52X-4 cfCalB7]
MKIIKIRSEYKILKFFFIKKNIYKISNFEKIKNIESKLKKAITIIHKYNLKNRRILFISAPIYLNKQIENLIKKTNHTILPESLWINGILTNTFLYSKLLSKKNMNKKISKLLCQLKKKKDLIVVFNKFYNRKILNEIAKNKISIIYMNYEPEISKNNNEYNIIGNFIFAKKQTKYNFILSILKSIFNKNKKCYNHDS